MISTMLKGKNFVKVNAENDNAISNEIKTSVQRR